MGLQQMVGGNTLCIVRKVGIALIFLSMGLLLFWHHTALAKERSNMSVVMRQAEDEELKGNIKEAKKLYLKAARAGNAESHFKLSILVDHDGQPVLSQYERDFHRMEAAKKGYQEAVDGMIGDLFFPVHSKYGGVHLVKANPVLAFDIYKQAKKANTELQLDDKNLGGLLESLQMCAAAGELEIQPLIKKYNVNLDGHLYDILYLAEEESKEANKVGRAKAQLILQLLCRGGDSLAPLAAFKSAVSRYYTAWKGESDTPIEIFERCDYASYSSYVGYSSHVNADIPGYYECVWQGREKDNLRQLKKLSRGADKKTQGLFEKTYQATKAYIEAYIASELISYRNLQSPDGRFDTELNTSQKLYDDYFQLIKEAKAGKIFPSRNNDLNVTNQEMEQMYAHFLAKRKKLTDDKGIYFYEVREIKTIWLNYRDAYAQLLAHFNPAMSENNWKIWLTERRTKELFESMQVADQLYKEL